MTEIIHYTDVDPATWRWPNFTPKEMSCRGDGLLLIVPSFMTELQNLRSEFGKPMNITSAYRSPEYNNRVSSTGLDGPHTTGRAIDVAIAGEDAHELMWQAIAVGFARGVGVKQKGPWDGRFLHFDNLTGDNRPRVWSY